MSSIKVSGVSKTYQPHNTQALRDINLELASKQFLAVVGPSGCGKSTLLQCIAGLEQIDAGTIHFDEQEVHNVPAYRRETVMVFQSILLFPHLSIFENVAFGLRVRKKPDEELRARVSEALEQVKIAHLQHKRPHQISGGEQQRVALARALVIRPKILLLDEPLANLDRHLWRDMTTLIRNLHERNHITTILVTHNQEEALLLGDKIAVMLEGQVAQVGNGIELYRRPATLKIARFFDPRNIHTAQKRGNSITTPCGTLRLSAENPYHTCPDGAVTVVIRPEDIIHCDDGNNTLHGKIISCRFTGNQWHTRVQIGNIEWETLSTTRHQKHAKTSIHIPPESLIAFPLENS